MNIDRARSPGLEPDLERNAHTGRRGRIEVSATDHGSKVVLAVTTTDPGARESDRERVFDRFAAG